MIRLFAVALSLWTLSSCTLLVPRMDRARAAALEAEAIHNIQVLHTAQVQYMSMNGKYATTLGALSDLIPADIATGQKGGYKFTMVSTPGGYEITALPIKFGETGNRTFFSDQSMVVHQNRSNAPATSSSPELQ